MILAIRCLLAAAFTGFTSLIYSLVGGLFAFFAMLLLKQGYQKAFSLTGVSMGGAVFHNIGQILAASLVLGNAVLFSYLPVLLMVGLVTGLLTSLVCIPLFGAIDHNRTLAKTFSFKKLP